MKKILIIGATSAIAEECSKKLIKSTESIFLFGRNKAKLDIIINDLKVRGVSKVGCNTFDGIGRDISAAAEWVSGAVNEE